jgi:nitrogen regulatory protein PII
MKAAKKIELIVSRAELESVIELLESHQLQGYSVIEGVKGKGDRGVQDGLGLTDAFENVMLVSIVSDDEFARLKEPIRAILRRAGGICALTSVESMRH